MDSRERTFLALEFQQPDRVPIDVWLSGGAAGIVEQATGMPARDFLDRHDVDLRYIEGPRYVGPPLRDSGDRDIDIWGVQRVVSEVPTPHGVERYKELLHSPLASAESVEDVVHHPGWPDPDWFDYSGIARQCQAVRDGGRVAVFMGDRLNRIAQLKPAMYIRGIERILTDLALDPEIAHAIFRKIREFYVTYAERVFESAAGRLDIVCTGDDFGTQNGPLVSPAMWEEFLADGFAAYTALAKAHGIRTMHHTCGAVRPIIPMLIDRGLDVLQSLQPEAAGMAPRELKADFGRKLAFHGGISIQRNLPFGTARDVENEVADTFEALAPGGGYIACTAHNIQADTSFEKIAALLEAYHKFGRY